MRETCVLPYLCIQKMCVTASELRKTGAETDAKPVQKPAQKPVQKPTQKPVQKPTQKSGAEILTLEYLTLS